MQSTRKLHSARARFRGNLPGSRRNRIPSVYTVVGTGTCRWLLVGCRLGGRRGGSKDWLLAILSETQQQVNESGAGSVSSLTDAHRRHFSQAKPATTPPPAETPPPPQVFYGKWERYTDPSGKDYYLDLQSGEAARQLIADDFEIRGRNSSLT